MGCGDGKGRARSTSGRLEPMQTATPGAAAQQPSHRALRTPLQCNGAAVSIDAVIVPSGRSARHLVTASRIANATDARLVVLTSSSVAAAAAECSRHAAHAIVIEVPGDYRHPMLEFTTSRHPEAHPRPYSNLAIKRNLALLLAKLMHWRKVLLLDDDIHGLDGTAVRRAAARLSSRYPAIGFKVNDFPDNSVLCHASRLAGNYQDTFLGANALLVDVSHHVAFYPETYGEDWFALYQLLRVGSIGEAGTVRQLAFDPFDQPFRATCQEFGDLLTEGLLYLARHGQPSDETNHDFWAAFICARARLAEDVAEALADTNRTRSVLASASVRAARERLASISPSACVTYMQAWRKDVETWQERISVMPRIADIGRALNLLDLPAAHAHR
jgi:hypothetical protein